MDYRDAVECLFGETGSSVMARLEDGPKQIAEIASEAGTEPGALMEEIAPLLKTGILRSESGALRVDGEKLDEALESDKGRFDGVTDGLTKMDGYLN